MKIGLGAKKDGAALLVAGCEKIFVYPDEAYLFKDKDTKGLREGDTLIIVQPAIFKPTDYETMREGCEGGILFQVVGHEPVALTTHAKIKAFRSLKAKGAYTEVKEITGRPRGLKYTVEQADAIIRLWHDVPKRKPADIVTVVDTILGVEAGTVKAHWVRDLVKKYVGTAQREKPAGWRGVRID